MVFHYSNYNILLFFYYIKIFHCRNYMIIIVFNFVTIGMTNLQFLFLLEKRFAYMFPFFTLFLFIIIFFSYLHFFEMFCFNFSFFFFTFCFGENIIFYTLEIFITLHLIYLCHSFCSYLYFFVICFFNFFLYTFFDELLYKD